MTAPELHIPDFTTEHYRSLLRLAKERYDFIGYHALETPGRVTLWRHDLDYSVHRALRMAQIEAEEGVRATYFVHLHCEFYHWNEATIAGLLRQIRSLGHWFGLHFDPTFYSEDSAKPESLTKRLAWERRVLEAEVGEICAFSFHNPDVGGDWLLHDSDSLAGMVNAYGKGLREKFTYCSDSNGYWRYQRLAQVLAVTEPPRLHVLTHPGWWQEAPMPPRQRIYRSLHQRFRRALERYDTCLESGGRYNGRGPSESLLFLKSSDPQLLTFLDELWNSQRLDTLFIELVRLRGRMENSGSRTDGPSPIRRDWRSICDALIAGEPGLQPAALEDTCVALCREIETLGEARPAAAVEDQQ